MARIASKVLAGRTPRELEKAVAGAGCVSGKRTEWRVQGVQGLVLVCQPSGSATWYCFYRADRGIGTVQRKVRLGERELLNIEQASAKCRELLTKANDGEDPWFERESRKGGRTLAELIDRRLERDHSLAAKTVELYRIVLKEVKDKIGRYSAASVTPAMVQDVLDDIAERGSRRIADIVKSALSSTYKWGRRHDRLDCANPCVGLGNRAAIGARNRVLSESELRALLAATDDDTMPLSVEMGSLIRVLVLTGQRRTEVAGMEWRELDLDADMPTWTIPGDTILKGRTIEGRTKNGKEHKLPLSRAAVRELMTMRVLYRSRDQVFNMASDSVTNAVKRVCKRAGLKHATPHDLRRTMATWMAEHGVQPDVIRRLLNHMPAKSDVLALHYDRATMLPSMRDALEKWGTYVDGLTAAKDEAAEDRVVRMPRRRASV